MVDWSFCSAFEEDLEDAPRHISVALQQCGGGKAEGSSWPPSSSGDSELELSSCVSGFSVKAVIQSALQSLAAAHSDCSQPSTRVGLCTEETCVPALC